MKEKYTRVAAYGLVTRDSKILLCRISKQVLKWQGYWTLPGGGIQFAEPPDIAAAREIHEETGIVAKVTKPLAVHSYHDDSGDWDFHGIQIIYQTEYVSGEPKSEIDGTTDYCQWYSFEQARHLPSVGIVKAGLDLVSGAGQDKSAR